MTQLMFPFRYTDKVVKDYQGAALRVFDNNPTHKVITLEALCTMIAINLNIVPSEYYQATIEIKKTILASPLFSYSRGRNGGVSLGRQFQPCSKLQEVCC